MSDENRHSDALTLARMVSSPGVRRETLLAKFDGVIDQHGDALAPGAVHASGDLPLLLEFDPGAQIGTVSNVRMVGEDLVGDIVVRRVLAVARG